VVALSHLPHVLLFFQKKRVRVPYLIEKNACQTRKSIRNRDTIILVGIDLVGLELVPLLLVSLIMMLLLVLL
jgi:hypothetical protein